jgi:hypothetical protein
MDIVKFFQSKGFQAATWIVAALLVALFFFQSGVFVGAHKADFTRRWSDNFERNFGGPRGGMMPRGIASRDFVPGGGAIGAIIKIDDSILTIKDRDGLEKSVLLDDKTEIRRFREAIKIADLKVDDAIVVIGEPNTAGQIAAKLIRVMPAPQMMNNLQK